MNYKHRLLVASATLVSFGLPMVAHAQSAPPTNSTDSQIADIIVTAQKRSTSLQETPLAIAAISGETLREQHVSTLADLSSLIPTMKFGSANSAAQITIRGVGNQSVNIGEDTPVAVSYNDVYVSRPSVLLGGMFDVASVEALYGPQGTLYGRNATAGAINITTERPSNDWHGFGRVSAGNYRAVNLEAGIGGPIIDDKLLVRIAGFYDRHDGYGKNLVTGQDVDDRNAAGIRGTVVIKPTEGIKFTGIAEYYSQDDISSGQHYFSDPTLLGLPGMLPAGTASSYPFAGILPTNPRDIASVIDPRYKLDYTALTGILEWSPAGPISLKSITGYRRSKSSNISQIGAGRTNLYIVAVEPDRQFSQELQAHYSSTRLNVTAGAYYFTEHDNAQQNVLASQTIVNALFGNFTPGPDNSFVSTVDLGGQQNTRAYAFFGEATWQFLPRLSLIAGLRYSNERKTLLSRYAPPLSRPIPVTYDPANPFGSIAPPPPITPYPPVTFAATTPKFGIQYDIDDGIMAYVTYSKGFKSGAYNIAQPTPNGVFQPERITDVEGGLKVTTLGRRLRANLSVFHYDYSNLQVAQTVGTAQIIQNAASAEVYGGELDLSFKPDSHLDLRFVGSYLHANYQQYVGSSALQPFLPSIDFSGNRLSNAPRFTGYWNAAYHIPVAGGDLTLRADAEYSGRFYFTPDNSALLSQKAYVKENIFLTYAANGGWSITGFVRNLSNRRTRIQALVATPSVAQVITGSFAPPRTYGAELRYSF